MLTKRSWVLVGALLGLGACVLSTETVSRPEEDGGPDAATLAALQAKIGALETKVEALEKQSADPDCPAGYVRAVNEPAGSPPPVHCQKGDPVFDEVVKVGSGGSAFWIDRYEASVWADVKGTMGVSAGVPFGAEGVDYPPTFPPNGQVLAAEGLLYARSRRGVMPSRWITWFQAQVACAAAGKRLPADEQWQLAAMATPDPTQSSDGSNGACLTNGVQPRTTGSPKADVNCASLWGAEDMIGNLWELSSDWQVGVGDATASLDGLLEWPNKSEMQAYHGDAVWNVVALVNNVSAKNHLPAAVQRGGSMKDGTLGGIWAIGFDNSPATLGENQGFRCVIPR